MFEGLSSKKQKSFFFYLKLPNRFSIKNNSPKSRIVILKFLPILTATNLSLFRFLSGLFLMLLLWHKKLHACVI